MFDQDVNDGLADHLPLLIFEKLAEGRVRFVNMRGSRNRYDSARIQRRGKKIGANNGLDEAVVDAEVFGKIKSPGGLGPNAVQLSGHAPLNRAVHIGRGERDAVAPGFS